MDESFSEIRFGELVLFAAEDTARLEARLRHLVAFLDQAPDALLKDVAYTCALQYDGVEKPKAVAALVVATIAELRKRLINLASRIAEGASRVRDRSGTYFFRDHLIGAYGAGKLAFVFPGAASFYPDMLRDVVIRSAICRLPFEELEEALSGKGAFTPSSFVFPPAPHYRHDADVFSAGGYAEAMAATYTANTALMHFFTSMGVKAEGVIGFSGGDLNALACAGLFGEFPRADRLAFLRDMYHTVDSCVRHEGLPRCVLFSVMMPQDVQLDTLLESLPEDRATLVFRHSPRQATIAVVPDVVEGVRALLSQSGARTMRLTVDRPFNTSWCKKVLPIFRRLATRWIRAEATIPVYACDRAEPLPVKTRKVRDASAELWTSPILLDKTIQRMWADGYRAFLEVGPRGMTVNSIADILQSERNLAAIPANAIHRAGTLQLLDALAYLAALGQPIKGSRLFEGRRVRSIDFDAPLVLEVNAVREQKLTVEFPRLTLVTPMTDLTVPTLYTETSGAGGKARARQAAAAERARLRLQFDCGFAQPLVAGSMPEFSSDRARVQRTLMLDFKDAPFLGDYALGAQGLSYSDRNLRGYTPLSLFVGAEIMAETAIDLVPNGRLVSVENLLSRRTVAFLNGKLRLVVQAERVLGDDSSVITVHAQVRVDGPDAPWTSDVLEATLTFLRHGVPEPIAFTPPALERPRDVHWTVNDIYPDRLLAGESLRGIRSADRWSEGGLDYEVEVLSPVRQIAHTRIPAWIINPSLMAAISDGFSLWRTHTQFEGAFSMPFRLRRLRVYTPSFREGQLLHCYLRYADATARSHVVDIYVSDGNGNLLMMLSGYERLAERIRPDYLQLLLSPSTAFLSTSLTPEILGNPGTPVASAVLADPPYSFLKNNEELWLKILASIVLGKGERVPFREMSGTLERRAEWLFGRIAAKEAVRRFLSTNYQARWSGADVQVWADDSGKPHALGAWRDFLTTKLDLAISHTDHFIVALVAANARVGVDVESQTRDLTDEFTRGVFTDDELDTIASAPNAPGTAIRYWCAKEAVSKALGIGIRFPPRELVVASYLPESGEITVSLEGQWLEAFKQFRGRTISVHVADVKDHVLASCFLPESFFA